MVEAVFTVLIRCVPGGQPSKDIAKTATVLYGEHLANVRCRMYELADDCILALQSDSFGNEDHEESVNKFYAAGVQAFIDGVVFLERFQTDVEVFDCSDKTKFEVFEPVGSVEDGA